MSSQERHRIKKSLIFKGGNFILSPISSKNISLNFMNTNNKKETKNKNKSNILLNDLSLKKSKKNLNSEFVRSNPNLLSFSRGNNSFLNAMKNNNNASNKNIINLTNNSIKKLYVNKKTKENNYFLNNSKSHNKNNNLGQKKLSFDYIQTEISTSNISAIKKNTKIQNIPNINLIFPPKNNFQKNKSNYYDELLSSPSGLFKKDLPNFKYNSSEKRFEEYYLLKKGKDEVRPESGTNQSSTNETKNIKKKKMNINTDVYTIGEKLVRKGPEELHWYFVKSIQDGKKLQTKI